MKKAISLLFALALCLSSHADETTPPLHVEGYAGQVSYAPGETLALHTSTTGSTYSVRISRVGMETKEVFAKKAIAGRPHPIPEDASSKGCRWPVSFELEIPSDWKSGYYEVTLSTQDSGGKFIHRGRRTAESSCYFVLRPSTPGKNSKILLQLATNTYNAYNNWGGSSLYGYHGRHGLQGHEVSFLRPPRSLFSRWEADFVKWAEAAGYELDYCSNMDLALRPEIAEPYRLILSVGHDEYWSWEMRDTIENFAAKGGNVAFFSGNTCCWQVRYEAESQSLVCWKQGYNQDPVFTADDKSRLSSLWSHHLIGRTENSMTGVGFIHGGYHKSHGQHMEGSGAFTLHRTDHWAFAGTDLAPGDALGGADTIVGYECDGCEIEWKDGLPFPTHADGTPKSFRILGTAPATWAAGDSVWYDRWPSLDHSGHAVMGVYETDGGGTVFTSGTTDWAHGLKNPDGKVSRITRNILEKLSK